MSSFRFGFVKARQPVSVQIESVHECECGGGLRRLLQVCARRFRPWREVFFHRFHLTLLCASRSRIAIGHPRAPTRTSSAAPLPTCRRAPHLSMAAPALCAWWLAPDYAYVGVLRTAPGCTMWRNRFACDGLCVQPGSQHDRDSVHDVVARPYGCWFYMAHAAANRSSAAVNVGRSLRASHRCDVNRLLGLPTESSDRLCSNADRLWCSAARAKGFDSIQVQRGTFVATDGRTRKRFSELVVCSDACTTREFKESACVPIAKRVAAGVEPPGGAEYRPCDCPAGALSLSCDGVHRAAPHGPRAGHDDVQDAHCFRAFQYLSAVPDRMPPPDAPNTACRLRATFTVNATSSRVPQ